MKEIALALCALLAFLLPIAIYCLFLASINRRNRPLIVSGIWDAVGLLFAVSGFFLGTIPMLLAEFYIRTSLVDGRDHFLDVWLQNWILWIVYFLFLITGCALMLLWRSHKTMIYNVDSELFPRALERTLALLGLGMKLNKEQLILTPMVPGEKAESTAVTETAPKPAAPRPDDSRHAELEIESFSSMCHITLHWDNYAPEVRREVERELDKSLESTAPLENPSAAWFLNISGLILGMLVMVMLTFVIVSFLPRR